jgi:exopolysaccharide production protein ExoY
LLIVLESGRPILYCQLRSGAHGRRIRVLKFRPVVPNADAVLTRYLAEHPNEREQWLRGRKLKHDPRIMPFGAWLRRTSLDELPQLINVIRGDMAIVGPRPLFDGELPRQGANWVHYMESTPGITGLSQLSGSRDLDYRRHLDD